MTRDDVNKHIAKLRVAIARGERSVTEGESTRNRSRSTDRALVALRESLMVQRAKAAELEKQLAQGKGRPWPTKQL
jgi:hypothetical protein